MADRDSRPVRHLPLESINDINRLLSQARSICALASPYDQHGDTVRADALSGALWAAQDLISLPTRGRRCWRCGWTAIPVEFTSAD